MRKLFCIILFIVFAQKALGQAKETIMLEQSQDKLFLSLTTESIHVRIGDTLHLRLAIRNEDTLNSIVFFNPNRFPLNPDSVCWYTIDEGGGWYVDLGRAQPLSLFMLRPKQEYNYEYRIIIDSLRSTEQRKCYTIIGTNDYNSITSRYITIYLGYCLYDGFFNNIDFNGLVRNGFDEKRGLEFERILKRILLGPVHVLVEK